MAAATHFYRLAARRATTMPEPDNDAPNGAESRSQDPAPLPRPRILIIDDALTIHEDFRKILVAPEQESPEMAQLEEAFLGAPARAHPRTGFAIDSAFQGEEGLARAQQAVAEGRPYVVAFVDVRMPAGWDGIETTARLRQADPDLQIVLCSAYSDYSWEQITERLGRGDGLLILKKPFDTREVLQLAECLNQKWSLARHAKSHLADLNGILSQRAQILTQLTQELTCANRTLAQEMAHRSQAQARLSAFSSLGRRLNGARTAREACQVIVAVADQLLSWDCCRIDLYSPEARTATHVLSFDLVDGRRKESVPDAPHGPLSALSLKTIQEGGQWVVGDNPLDAVARQTPGAPASILSVPIRDGHGVRGVLWIQSYNPNAYDSSSLETLQALADHSGGTLERIALRAEAEAHGGISNDIALNEAQNDLQQARMQLAETSRRADLAEVATGVLHNVGNVLNNVNVSVNVLAEALKCSKTPNLSGIVTLLNDHASDLGRFITDDPKGRQVPRYLEHLVGHMVNQHAFLSDELQLLAKNVDHIKKIVAMQQTYAKVSGGVETVNAEELVEDALNLNTGALRRHGVRVIRRYDSHAPRLTVDRHKVLQLLVNLIGNAKYACDESGRSDKQMTVRIANGSDRVCISVEDNGIGIPQESLPRIFTLGFTTRKDGHGFGLHNCALAAKEMGGSLAVHSDGTDQGAIFKLELPSSPQN